MEFAEIIKAVIEIGLPSIICLFFLWRLAKQDERHSKQYDKLSEAVMNNTQVINELCYLIKDLKDDLNKGENR